MATNIKRKKGTLPDAENYEGEIIENAEDNGTNDVAKIDAVFNPTSVDGVTNVEENGAEFSPEEVTPVEKQVKIRLNSEYKGCIGGQRLYFKKDEVYTVDQNVKRILNNSGLLKPLN